MTKNKTKGLVEVVYTDTDGAERKAWILRMVTDRCAELEVAVRSERVVVECAEIYDGTTGTPRGKWRHREEAPPSSGEPSSSSSRRGASHEQ